MQFLKRMLRRCALRRRPGPFARALLAAVEGVRPGSVRVWRESSPRYMQRRVTIVSPETEEENLFKRMTWGDFWVRHELVKALGELGYAVVENDADVVLHLFGKPADLPPHATAILWIYSHPELVTPELLGRYDRVFCLSEPLAEQVRSTGFEARCAFPATSVEPVVLPSKRDVVFVGNHRNAEHDDRWKILQALAEADIDLHVWGGGWDGVLPEPCIRGPYFDYVRLPLLYGSSRISLSMHAPEMRENHMVAVRVLDILASGGFCVSDRNPGLETLFGDAVPQFDGPEEACEMVRRFLDDDDERRRRADAGRDAARAHTWRLRAAQLLDGTPPRRDDAL